VGGLTLKHLFLGCGGSSDIVKRPVLKFVAWLSQTQALAAALLYTGPYSTLMIYKSSSLAKKKTLLLLVRTHRILPRSRLL
jgi:hypothetical protein